MNSAATMAILAEHCKELRMPTIMSEYPGLVRQAQDGDWPYESFLQELFEREVIKRRQIFLMKSLKEKRLRF